jgi:hypothetical protein
MFSSVWSIEQWPARDVGISSSDQGSLTVSHIKFGNDSMALAVGNPTNAIIYTTLLNPTVTTHILSREVAKVVALHWHSVQFHLLVVATNGIFVVDCAHNSELVFFEVPALIGSVVNAFWTQDGFFYLTDRKVIAFVNSAFEESHKQDLGIPSRPCSAAIDGETLFIGAHGTVSLVSVSGGQAIVNHTFIAHPRNVERIQVRPQIIATSADGGTVVWAREDLVPLFAVKAEGMVEIDPEGEFGIGGEKGGGAVVVALKRGKKAEVREKLRITIGGKIICDWKVGEQGSKTAALVNDSGSLGSLVFVRLKKKQ